MFCWRSSRRQPKIFYIKYVCVYVGTLFYGKDDAELLFSSLKQLFKYTHTHTHNCCTYNVFSWMNGYITFTWVTFYKSLFTFFLPIWTWLCNIYKADKISTYILCSYYIFYTYLHGACVHTDTMCNVILPHTHKMHKEDCCAFLWRFLWPNLKKVLLQRMYFVALLERTRSSTYIISTIRQYQIVKVKIKTRNCIPPHIRKKEQSPRTYWC